MTRRRAATAALLATLGLGACTDSVVQPGMLDNGRHVEAPDRWPVAMDFDVVVYRTATGAIRSNRLALASMTQRQ